MYGNKDFICEEIYCDLEDMVHAHYTIPGVPIPLARPRMGKGILYDAQKKDRHAVAHILSHQHKGRPWFKGPLSLELYFFFPIPPSYSHKKKHTLWMSPINTKPDLSNLIKFIEDAANGILFKDDAQIATIRAFKLYGDPKTEIVVSEEK